MEGIWAVQERGVEVPSALDQEQQLEPTWEDELLYPQVMGCCILRHVGVHPGSVWAERVPPTSRSPQSQLPFCSEVPPVVRTPQEAGTGVCSQLGSHQNKYGKVNSSKSPSRERCQFQTHLLKPPYSCFLLWLKLCASKRQAAVLTPRTRECDLTWKYALGSLGCADSCKEPSKLFTLI